MANIQKLRMLRETIAAAEPEAIDLNFYFQSSYQTVRCGTAGCIAGWAISLFDPDRYNNTEWATRYAREALEMSTREKWELDDELEDAELGPLFDPSHFSEKLNDKDEALARLDFAIAYFEEKAEYGSAEGGAA